jgi:hypothetical protein
MPTVRVGGAITVLLEIALSYGLLVVETGEQMFVHYALAELFLGSHLTHLQARAALSPDQARQWWAYLQQADERGTLLISFTSFVVVGAKH